MTIFYLFFFLFYMPLVLDIICSERGNKQNVFILPFITLFQKVFNKKTFDILMVLYFIVILIFVIILAYVLIDGDGIFDKQTKEITIDNYPHYSMFVLLAVVIWLYHLGIEIRLFYRKYKFNIRKWFSQKGLFSLYHLVMFPLLTFCLVISERNLILNDNITDEENIQPIEKELEELKKELSVQKQSINSLNKKLLKYEAILKND